MKKRHILRLAGVLLLALGLTLALLRVLGGLSPAQAAPGSTIRYVASTGDDIANICTSPIAPCRTVQQAVNVAGWANDEIRVATGIYTGTLDQVLFIQKTTTIRGGYTTTDNFADPPDPDGNPTTLDGRGQMRVVDITGNVTPTLEGLRLTNGSPAEEGGGGIRAEQAHPVISNCHIYSNTTNIGGGGGVFLDRGSGARLIGNEIYSNTARSSGGGVNLRLSSWSRLTGNEIYSNSASSDGSGVYVGSSNNVVLTGNWIHENTSHHYGGGIYVAGNDVTLTNNEVFENRADGSGGICLSSSDGATVTGNRVYNNTAESEGSGGIRLYYSDDAHLTNNEVYSNTAGGCSGGVYLSSSESGVLTGNKVYSNTASTCAGGVHLNLSHHAALTGNKIYRNVAGSGNGGGIYLGSSQGVTLTNNMVTDNQITDTHKGAGIYVYDSDVRLLHTTIARNSGGEGQGVDVWQALGTGVVSLTNTILVSHTIGIQTHNGAAANLTATLWGDGIWANGANTVGSNIDIGTLNVWGDPVFMDSDSGDYHLCANSAAVDQGVSTGTVTDIDGDPRAIGQPDLGADEIWKRVYLPLVLR